MKVEAGLYGKDLVPDGFDYDVAPPRGWQEGKKDFTDKVTYYKWHVFDDTDDYALIS